MTVECKICQQAIHLLCAGRAYCPAHASSETSDEKRLARIARRERMKVRLTNTEVYQNVVNLLMTEERMLQ